MARRITAAVAHDETAPIRLVGEHIPDDAGIEVTEVFGTFELNADAILRLDVDLLLVACREGSEGALGLLQTWNTVRSRTPVVLMSHGSDHDFVQAAFAAGADDFLVLHPGPYIPEQISRDVEFAIRKAVTRNRTASDRGQEEGQLIAVLGSKGGVGKTVAASNLGVALAMRGKRTVLIDLDLQFGDVALALGLAPETTLFDLAVSGGSLDADKLDDFMLRHSSGLRVLAAPARPDQAVSVTAQMLSTVYSLLRQEYDFVVVDTPPAFTSEVIATVDVASWICMVAMFDALSLKNTRLGLDTLELMGHPAERVRVVLNRAGTNVGISDSDAVQILGRTPDVLVPSDREIPVSINDGVPITLSGSKSTAATAINSLANMFVQADADAVNATAAPLPVKHRRRLFRRSKSAATAGELASGA
jgi:pilus assembly protein CpaE